MADAPPTPRLAVTGWLLAGFGLGGLADGIVLHHVLQWHNLISARVPADDLDGLRQNLVWDGVFHLGATVALVTGALLVRAAWHSRAHVVVPLRSGGGLALIGWGAFHLVDQLLFHMALGLHDIRPGADAGLWNAGYTAVGLLLGVAGWALWRSGRRRPVEAAGGAR